jgi:exopolysaccharide biosynthesis polyprenyl glycosylphosphotransferase
MRRALAAADTLGLLLAIGLTEFLVGSRGGKDAVGLQLEFVLLIGTIPVWILAANLAGLYERDEERADNSSADDLVRVFLFVTVGAWLTYAFAGLTGKFNPDPVKMTLLWVFAVACMAGSRVVARQLARRSDAYRQRTMIVGGGPAGQLVARKLLLHPEYGIELLGFIDDEGTTAPTWLENEAPTLGGLSDLCRLADELYVERVIFTHDDEAYEATLAAVRWLRDAGVQVDIVPRLYEVMGPRIDIHTVEGMSLVGLPPVRLSRTGALAKRAVDVVVAGTTLIVCAPLMALIAVLIRRGSPGPAFYRSTRLGRDMRPFTFLKFRTMRVDTDDAAHRAYIVDAMSPDAGLRDEGGTFKLDQSDRVTRIGAWLRRTSLDELPQLINVLRGDMSLVGPRPCLEWETEVFEPHHFERFIVPAGVTGLWQVSARAQATFREALDLDVLYAHSATLGLDLRLLMRTPLQLLRSNSTT